MDTHVGRLAVRLHLTWTGRNEKDAVRIENDLMELLPRKEWTFAGHALIWHGRRVCTARKFDCPACTLNKICPSANAFDTERKTTSRPKAKPKRKPAGRASNKKHTSRRPR